MKPIIYVIAVCAVLFVSSGAVLAQCDRTTSRPIKCGFYDEGFEDGLADAQANRPSDFRRYRDKFDRQYEDFYRNGYNQGYASTGPAYPTYPGTGEQSGSATWSGRVDNIARLMLQGNTLQVQDLTNSGVQTTNQNVNGALPRRAVIVNANKFAGRGTVTIVQQPSRANGYAAIIEISDTRGGADNYRVDLNWQSSGPGREEPYSPGRVTWRGRVDNTANIIVAGNSVSTETVAGSPAFGQTSNINGYLAARPGSIRVRKVNGRGTVNVVQQPSWENDYTAIIRIYDSDGGADNYELEISW